MITSLLKTYPPILHVKDGRFHLVSERLAIIGSGSSPDEAYADYQRAVATFAERAVAAGILENILAEHGVPHATGTSSSSLLTRLGTAALISLVVGGIFAAIAGIGVSVVTKSLASRIDAVVAHLAGELRPPRLLARLDDFLVQSAVETPPLTAEQSNIISAGARAWSRRLTPLTAGWESPAADCGRSPPYSR